MKHFVRCLLIALLLACKPAPSNYIKSVNASNVKSIFNKPLNLVFFWTTWCGVSQSLLKETYSALQKDSNQYNIIIICGNHNPEGIEKQFTSSFISLTPYLIENASNTFPMLDRKNIKSFIIKHFAHPEKVNLDGNFGIPITMLVDSSLHILHGKMPQDSTGIRNEIARYP